MSSKDTLYNITEKEQLFIDRYKKQAKLAWYTSESESASIHQAWKKCYTLALMLSPLPECKVSIKEISYSPDRRIKRFANDSINIAYACSDEFAPFCGISVFSLIANSDSNKNYDIIIMHAGSLSQINKKHLCALAEGKQNISIRFIDCLETQLANQGSLRSYFASEVYFRCLLLTDFFDDYDRFVYIDSDTVINTDISALFEHNMSGKPISAVKDLCMEYLVNSGSNLVLKGTVLSYNYYLKNLLKLDCPSQYFNSGVMLMDIKQLRSMQCYEEICKMIHSGSYYCFDQCVFNYVFKGKVDYLSHIWNVQNITNVYGNYDQYVSEETLSHLLWCIPRYKIMHFIGPRKPWYKPDHKSSDIFIAYASQTVWFRPIIYAALADKAEDYLQAYKNKSNKKI